MVADTPLAFSSTHSPSSPPCATAIKPKRPDGLQSVRMRKVPFGANGRTVWTTSRAVQALSRSVAEWKCDTADRDAVLVPMLRCMRVRADKKLRLGGVDFRIRKAVYTIFHDEVPAGWHVAHDLPTDGGDYAGTPDEYADGDKDGTVCVNPLHLVIQCGRRTARPALHGESFLAMVEQGWSPEGARLRCHISRSWATELLRTSKYATDYADSPSTEVDYQNG